MKVCGIALKASSAIFVILEGTKADYKIVESDFKRVDLDNKSKNQEEVKSFRSAVENFVRARNFDRIGIKERFEKGQFKGGAVSFKMEALIQSVSVDVGLVHPNPLSREIKKHELKYDDVLAYQKEAKQVAFYLLP